MYYIITHSLHRINLGNLSLHCSVMSSANDLTLVKLLLSVLYVLCCNIQGILMI